MASLSRARALGRWVVQELAAAGPSRPCELGGICASSASHTLRGIGRTEAASSSASYLVGLPGRRISSSPIAGTLFSTRSPLPRDPTDPRQYIIKPPTHFGFVIVPEKQAYVVQRFGRHLKVLESGLHFLIPIFDTVAFVHDLRETAVPIANQAAITRDNVHITIDGVLYVRTVDPVRASYGVQHAIVAVTQLAQTTMRSELGKITLDKTFEERDSLNRHIVQAINEAAEAWGLQCLRYEIRDITPPPGVQRAMEMQAEAERRKRAQILDSEGEQQSVINRAEAHKRDIVLQSEARREESMNRALGESIYITNVANATAASIERVAAALQAKGAPEAAALRVAERYVEAFSKLAKESNTLLLPANAGDPAAMVAQALGVFGTVSKAVRGGEEKAGEGQGAQ